MYFTSPEDDLLKAEGFGENMTFARFRTAFAPFSQKLSQSFRRAFAAKSRKIWLRKRAKALRKGSFMRKLDGNRVRPKIIISHFLTVLGTHGAT